MWIHRKKSDILKRAAATFPAVVVTGARQSGKTSLLKRVFPNHNYVSLDIPSRAAQAEEEPELFLSKNPPPLIVDEVQYAPKLFRHLKVAIDADRHAYGQFILTGSQKFTLMRAVSDSLAGRCAVMELETLSLSELLESVLPVLDTATLLDLLVRGGFPELWQNRGIDPVTFYGSYLATYLERDVRQLVNVVNLRDFERFVRACAARNGQLLEKSSLARDVGISASTCNEWISVLVASNQIFLLEPWFGNFTKRLIKSPKLYFADTGLLCFLLNLTADTLAESPFVGSIWEALVYAELRKATSVSGVPQSIWMYRDVDRIEIDFLVQSGSVTRAVECKWTEIPSLADAKPLLDLMSYLAKKPSPQLDPLRGYILCRTPDVFPLGHGIRAIPLSALDDEVVRGLST